MTPILSKLGIRTKLILLFILIKVVPLLLLAYVAWNATDRLGETVSHRASEMADGMVKTLKEVGNTLTQDSIKALDTQAQINIERITTDTARAVASFLYDRDADILAAAQLAPTEAAYRQFLETRVRTLIEHPPYRFDTEKKKWVTTPREGSDTPEPPPRAATLEDNASAFHANAANLVGMKQQRPLFVEMTFLDLSGVEKVKVQTKPYTPATLANVKDRRQTYAKAEQYWQALVNLKPGEIFVSDVIGPYVKTELIGAYTPEAAEKAGKPFHPEKSGYAGLENPVGQRFKGIVRWAMPVVQGGRKVGYVTLALDHDHLRQFTDRILPTEPRYTDIANAASGNYAFMWDYQGRSISHPRDYFIVGYNPETGLPATPWLDQTLFEAWQASGKGSDEFLKTVTPYENQSIQKKPAGALVKAGTVGLDCRYLNFSPQCEGWRQVTENSGSGSFAIYFSGLWKLTTAAAIPYYTGPYGRTGRGFGFITIGANMADFHAAATESAKSISAQIDQRDQSLSLERGSLLDTIQNNLTETTTALSVSTIAMVIAVIFIAILIAQLMTHRITEMVAGIESFQAGALGRRLPVRSHDEMGRLAQAFNKMADGVQESFSRSEEARRNAEAANRAKSEFLAGISHELRTPLNGILGFSELLELDASDPAHRDYAKTIHASGRQLLSIVNDLLDLAKIEAGRLEINPAPFDVRTFAKEVLEGHRIHAENKGLDTRLTLEENIPNTMISDAQRVRQILDNLINNAIKFTESGHIELRVERKNSGLQFTVADTGCGIPANARELIFEKFRQADRFVSRKQGGTGLGLALSRQLARLLGGDVVLNPGVTNGSEFVVYISAEIPA